MKYLIDMINSIPGLTYKLSGNLIVLSEHTNGFNHAYYIKTRFGRQQLHRELIRLKEKSSMWDKFLKEDIAY